MRRSNGVVQAPRAAENLCCFHAVENVHLVPRAPRQRLNLVLQPFTSQTWCSVSVSVLRSPWSSSMVFEKHLCVYMPTCLAVCAEFRARHVIVVARACHALTLKHFVKSEDSVSVSTPKVTLQTGTVQLTGGSVRLMGHVSAFHSTFYADITSCQLGNCFFRPSF